RCRMVRRGGDRPGAAPSLESNLLVLRGGRHVTEPRVSVAVAGRTARLRRPRRRRSHRRLSTRLGRAGLGGHDVGVHQRHRRLPPPRRDRRSLGGRLTGRGGLATTGVHSAPASGISVLCGDHWPREDVCCPLHEVEPPPTGERMIMTFRANGGGAGTGYTV